MYVIGKNSVRIVCIVCIRSRLGALYTGIQLCYRPFVHHTGGSVKTHEVMIMQFSLYSSPIQV